MAQVTFTIPNDKLQYFVDCYGQDYDEKVAKGELSGVTKEQYAKDEAFKYLAQKVRVWHKQQQLQQIQEVDITV